MEYFKFFPKVNYNFDGRSVQVTDISARVTLPLLIPVEQDIKYKYLWKNTDVIDRISELYYRGVDLWWVVLLSNTTIDPVTELPRDVSQIAQTIIEKYRFQAYEQVNATTDTEILTYVKGTIFQYRDADGDPIDETTFTQLTPSERSSVTIFDHEFEVNDSRRDYELVDNTLAGEIRDSFQTLMESR